MAKLQARLDENTRYMVVPPEVLEEHGRIMASDAARQFKLNDHRFRQCCWKLGIEIDEHDTVLESDLDAQRSKFKKTADEVVKREKKLLKD